MYPDRDFDLDHDLPSNEPDLSADLELGVMLRAMAGEDKFLYSTARQGLHSGLTIPEEIVYRQHVLADCIDHSDVVRELYDLAVETITAESRAIGFSLRDSPESIGYRARQQLELYAKMFRRLREISDVHAAEFRSEGFTRFFAMLCAELDDAYLAEVEAQISELEFRHGTLMSARLGSGNKGAGYVLRRHPEQGWREWMSGLSKRSAHTFTVPERDENGLMALSDLTNRGLNSASNALAQSVDHIRAFFGLLRAELGFYLGCLNLRDRLTATDAPVCFPVPGSPVLDPTGCPSLSACYLYDASLALSLRDRAVGNDVDAGGKQLIMVTGANQGGKSTFLRSTGQAQLMMQAGMFVAAQSYAASLSTGIFTHFKREEDAAMEMGKLDEELDRMSRITGQLGPGCLLLCNESFASTNEREGSEIARQVIRALTEARIRVIFVTHLYDLAGRWYARHDPAALFLRAERQPDGHRTFRVPPGEPLPTSYGQDLYQQVFGTAGM
jgi:DNA mismatch repair ATPase MutS